MVPVVPDASCVGRPIGSRFFSIVGMKIGRSAAGYDVTWNADRVRALIRMILVAVVAFYAVLWMSIIVHVPLWGPFSTRDEQLQYYQVARNYNEYGFVTTMLLPDLSTSASSSGHPYLYTHQ